MSPPPRDKMQADARQELQRIAALALKMKLDQRLEEVIRKTMAELEQQESKGSKNQ